MSSIFLKVFTFLIVLKISISAETTWVWNTNRSPQTLSSQSGSQNSNFGEVNFGRDRDRDRNGQNGKPSIFPESPSRPSSIQGENSALPADSIRLVNNGNSEARLIPGAANFVSNALQSIGGGGGGSGGTGGGLFSIGGNLISSIFQSVPQLTGSALEILLGRPSKGNSASGSSSSKPSSGNGVSTLPASTSGTTFPILTPGGGSFSRPAGTSSGNSGLSSTSGSCRCIPSSQCFLPNTEGGSCAGGNKLCCSSSTRTRSIPNDEQQNTRDQKPTKSDEDISLPPADVRLGLLENIVKGGSNVVDDTLDFLLLRYYTEEDQKRLANRVLKSG